MMIQLVKGHTIVCTAKVELKQEVVVLPIDNGCIHFNSITQLLYAVGIDVFFPNGNKMHDDRCPFIYQHIEYELIGLTNSPALKFDYYRYKSPLTIGKSELNDIRIALDEDGFFERGKIALSSMPFVEGKKQRVYAYGQTIQLDKTILIIHPDFVMVNRGQHQVRLEKYQPHKGPIRKRFYIDYSPPYRSDSMDDLLHYQLENRPSYRIHEPSTLISTLGPGLTMASASLFLASFNIYTSYQGGKKIDALIPMLIFPLAMVVSLIFWQPLIRYLEKKRSKKYNQIQYEIYMMYLDKFILKIERELEHFRQTKILFHGDDPYCILPHHHLFFRLYLGQGRQQELMIINRQSSATHPMIDPEIDQLIEAYQVQEYPVIFDFKKSNKLAIVGNKSYLRSLIYQLVFCRSYHDLKCVFFGSAANLSAYFSTKHFYQDALYLQITNLMTRQHVLNSVKGRFVVAIVLEQHLFIDLEKDYYAIYYYDHLEQIKDAFDCIINQKLIKLDQNVQLTCDVKEDYKASFNHLRQYRLKQSVEKHKPPISFFDLNQLLSPYDQVILNKWHKKKHGLEVLIGINEYQMPISLNLHEAYDGPHGLIAGTTGSGKTELLISLLLGLCTNYSYKDVQLVLIDFKGVNLIECFRGFPHLVGEVSNIELSCLKRALISLKNECIKREKAFEALSQYLKHSVGSYDRYIENYVQESDLEYFARIVIVVDEFAELKRQSPEFIEELVSIARIGRSLGFHLIMATQKPSGILDAQIWANMHYKICLRVQDKQDALDVIESTDSYYLQKPGAFYLKSSRIYLKAQATLATCSYQNFKFNHAVHLYKEQGISIESAKMERPKAKSQLQIIKEAIQSIAKKENAQIPQLWLLPLSPQYLNTYPATARKSIHKIMIGLSDHLENATQKPKYIDLKQDCPLVIKTASIYEGQNLIQKIIESCDPNLKFIYIIEEQPQYHRFNHQNISYIDPKIDCNIDYFLNHVQAASLVIVHELNFCIHSERRWQKLMNLASTKISLIVVDSKKQLSQQKIICFKKTWFHGLSKYEFESPLKTDLKSYELYDGQHIICLFKSAINRGKKLGTMLYLKYPVQTKHLKKKWLIGYDTGTLKPIYLSYECSLTVLGALRDDYGSKMEKTINLLSKTSVHEAMLWLDNQFPPLPFTITSTQRRENEALLHYEGKTQCIYLAYE